MPSLRRRNRSPELQAHESAEDASELEEPQSPSLFRARLAAGDYDAVIGQGLRRILRDAAADTTLEAEVGALRVTLAKLLSEEDDSSRLAAGVSRVAGVAVQAARLRGSVDADAAAIRSALLQELEAFEREQEEARLSGQDMEMQRDDADG